MKDYLRVEIPTISICIGQRGGDKMEAYKCDDCGALAEEMPYREESLFRKMNGDHKMVMQIYFYDGEEEYADLCLTCKIKYLRLVIERLKKRREEGKNA